MKLDGGIGRRKNLRDGIGLGGKKRPKNFRIWHMENELIKVLKVGNTPTVKGRAGGMFGHQHMPLFSLATASQHLREAKLAILRSLPAWKLIPHIQQKWYRSCTTSCAIHLRHPTHNPPPPNWRIGALHIPAHLTGSRYDAGATPRRSPSCPPPFRSCPPRSASWGPPPRPWRPWGTR